MQTDLRLRGETCNIVGNDVARLVKADSQVVFVVQKKDK